ncbi:hypothetical protein [Niameybacter massiliensis]|uniref:hypothetical protein n=1 Tax=Niameybacter massiliensis TaxID=1658108 RepID=UPI0006B5732E|nr:hypothetical protein [Niameybacter massiliensis]
MGSSDIEQVIIKYKDGTEKVLDKGMVVSTEQDEEEIHVSMSMCNMSGKEVTFYLESLIRAYAQMQGWDDLYEDEIQDIEID